MYTFYDLFTYRLSDSDPVEKSRIRPKKTDLIKNPVQGYDHKRATPGAGNRPTTSEKAEMC